jgi:predicted Zn-dependent protease
MHDQPRFSIRRAGPSDNAGGGSGGSRKGRWILALVIAVVSLISYFGAREYNPVTDEVQHIDITVEQEIALGLQAAPEMAAQYGGLYPNKEAQAHVDEVGQRVVAGSAASETPYDFEFHLLADDQTINAFALPGGQIFITAGLLQRLETEAQLAGVLAHEVGHVVARHSAEHIAKARLTEGLTGAAVIAAYDPNDPSSQRTAQVAAVIGQLINMHYGREDEIESDRLGVRFMSEAGYDPRAMIEVMRILASASEGQRPPEFFSTHPNPDRRIENIRAAIQDQFPNGVPDDLTG